MDRDEELFKRLECLMADVKFTKELQWRNVNWAILVFGALIALFQLPAIPIGWCFPAVFAKILGTVVAMLAAVFLVFYQCDHAGALSRYRLQMRAVERLLRKHLLKQIDENAKRRWPRLWQKAGRSKEGIYFGPFVATFLVSAVMFIVMICVGRPS